MDSAVTRHSTRLRSVYLSVLWLCGVAFTCPSTTYGQASYEIVTSFDVPDINGTNPRTRLIEASDGMFYGAAEGGFGHGILFRMDASGTFTVLHRFIGSDGTGPQALVQATVGDFYGTTSSGGEFGYGTVFRFDANGILTTLHSFAGLDGANPAAALLQASDGYFYGTTARGGTSFVDAQTPGYGTVFRIDAVGAFVTLYSFRGIAPPGTPFSQWDHGNPGAPLIEASDGYLYGTARGFVTPFGGVFRIDKAGRFMGLHSFPRDKPTSGLIQASDGYFYGTASSTDSFFNGTVFRMNQAGTTTTVHTFSDTDGDSAGGLIEAADGFLYGTTLGGNVFRMTAAGAVTTLIDLSGEQGRLPRAGVIQGSDGRFYGTASEGGPGPVGASGTVFRIDASRDFATLHAFVPSGAGAFPQAGLSEREGIFYGTTLRGGTGGWGTVFMLDQVGALTTLHDFVAGSDGRAPAAEVLPASDGKLYGTTEGVYSEMYGSLFSLDATGTLTTVHAFTVDDAAPASDHLIEASDGSLYGTTHGGIFRFDAAGVVTTVPIEPGADVYASPHALIEAADGSFYGMTLAGGEFRQGTIFRLDPGGTLTTLYTFNGFDGAFPTGALIQTGDGSFYGTTARGGNLGLGTVFRFDQSGTLTTVYSFSGNDGALPLGGLIQGRDGRLYGATRSDESMSEFGFGTVFAIDTTGTLETLHRFTGADGAYPRARLLQVSDGSFYGTTESGGPRGGGVIFRVRLATSPPDQYFELVSRNSGKCLDVYGAATDAAAPIIQWTCHRGPNQQWRLEPAGGGAFRIIARHSGQALDVYGAFVEDVTPIIQYPVHGGDNQAWRLEPASDGYVRIVAQHSGKAMDVENASLGEGARVIQYTPHGGVNQQWLLRGLDSTAP
jgi:uncharacterized repeat protein (TIGR03803 family)